MRGFGLTQTGISGLLYLGAGGYEAFTLGAIWNFSKVTGLP